MKKKSHNQKIFYTEIESPIGELLLTADGGGLIGINFQRGPDSIEAEKDWIADDRPFAEVIAQLNGYFAGELKEFDLQIGLKGTEFQVAVWEALRAIPYGETISYGELADRIGNPKAVRAVGGANGKNPIPVIVPCHRVIGSDGSLTGFGGGLPIKEALLKLEGANYGKEAAKQTAFSFGVKDG